MNYNYYYSSCSSSSPCSQYSSHSDNICKVGKRGKRGKKGIPGIQGIQGIQCIQGIQGIPGIMNISNFYSLMPPDNSATIAIGAAINFNQDGPNNNTTITRISPSTFNLELVGIYEIIFQVSINEAAQLVIVLNGTELDYTVVGRATGTNQIIGDCLILTTTPNSVLSINNSTASAAAITITPFGGGTKAISANLIIKKYE